MQSAIRPIAASRVTIVVIRRERHGLTLTALESIRRNTAMLYRLIYVDSGIPSWLRAELLRRAGEWPLEVTEFADAAWPNHLRKRIATVIDTPYVVFVDNDVTVAPGWLESLIACADETGAGIVCPLYMIGDAGTTKIHMAGGLLIRIEDPGGTLLVEQSLLKDHDLAEAGPGLRRRECDFA
ncbi:MAG: glycosyltransferase family 2 protein, partial [Terriglobia bacterium]